MFNDRSTPISLLSTRRSGKPRDLVAPGPDNAQLRTILSVGMRTPDHGKLAPWRFVIVPPERREAFADMLDRAYGAERAEPGRLEREANRQFALQAPVLITVLFTPVPGKIPLWEQELSAGAACMNILTATHALGYHGGWLTTWAAFSDEVKAGFGGGANDRIAGFIFIGTSAAAQEERPRPDYDKVVSVWQPSE